MATGAAASSVLGKGKKSHSKKKILGGLAGAEVVGVVIVIVILTFLISYIIRDKNICGKKFCRFDHNSRTLT